ncbi:MAG: phenylpyruvate tautomerase MIF-related protein [Thermodesulfobacteriota bacterium]
MPYLKIETNADLGAGGADALAARASELVGELTGKPERWVMARVEAGAALRFGGAAEPAAFVEMKSIGLSAEACPRLAEALCAFLQAEAGIPPERVYIEFKDLERGMFGWKGGTF